MALNKNTKLNDYYFFIVFFAENPALLENGEIF